MDNIGNIFASYRKNLKYSQQDICDKLTGMGIPTKPAAYSTWETGNSIPNAVQFLAMCKILGITDIFNQFIGGYNPDDPMAELNEKGRAMALNYIDLLKGSEKYQAAPVRLHSVLCQQRLVGLSFLLLPLLGRCGELVLFFIHGVSSSVSSI